MQNLKGAVMRTNFTSFTASFFFYFPWFLSFSHVFPGFALKTLEKLSFILVRAAFPTHSLLNHHGTPLIKFDPGTHNRERQVGLSPVRTSEKAKPAQYH
jgi:hypothetical protein